MLNVATTRGPERDAWLFYVGRFARDSARGLLAVLAVIYLATIGFDTYQAGILLGVSLAGGFALSIVVMLTVGRISSRVWSVCLMSMTAAAGVLLIVSDNFWVLTIGSFVGSYAASGVHWGAMTQLEQTGLTRVVPSDARTRAFSILAIGSSVGRAVGALLAGVSTLLISSYSWDAVDAYRLVLVIYVILDLIAVLIYSLLSRAAEPVVIKSAETGADLSLPNPFQARSRRRILTISGLFAVDSLAGGMIFESFLSFWLFTKFGMSAAAIGGLLIASQLANMISLAMAPTVARRFGLLNTLVFSQVLSNLMLILFAFAPNAIVAIALWMLRSLFDEMDVPTRQSYMMAITDPDEHSIMAGTANLGRGMGRIPSATITGMLWSVALTVTPWILAGGLKLAYDAVIYITFRHIKPQEEEHRL